MSKHSSWINKQTFFTLLQAGLWENSQKFSVECLKFRDSVDWDEVYRLASEQSVLGLVLAGIEQLPLEKRPPQEMLLQMIGEVQMIEQQNLAMNRFVAELVEKMRRAGIYTLLVKGQGVAQCYERPVWRSSGDVDFLLSERNYKEAKEYLLPLASTVQEEDTQELHLGMEITPWLVEIHGTLRSCSLPKMDKVIDNVQRDVFCDGNVRSWMNGETQVFLPGADCDVIFVFTHIIKHFFRGGIGLRQICDFCRLLWTYHMDINLKLLASRIKKMGMTTEWKAFAYLAVNVLGMPKEAMPLYSPAPRWGKKADKILTIILKTGSFGHNIDRSYMTDYGPLKRKITTLWHGTMENCSHFFIFPMDSIKVWFNMLKKGVLVLMRGER